jgi:hypothetical protein
MTHVKLGRNGSGSDRCTENDTTSLGPEGRRGDRVDDGSSLLIRGLLYMISVSVFISSFSKKD